jgi:hypothetical protein
VAIEGGYCVNVVFADKGRREDGPVAEATCISGTNHGGLCGGKEAFLVE